MEKFMIMCEVTIVSRGTIKKRKTYIYKRFEKLSDAEFMMEKLYKKYNKKASHQLDERIKTLSFRGKHLVVVIGNGDCTWIVSRLYYISKRMM